MYRAQIGLPYQQNVSVPPAPSLSNPGSWFNQLQLILDTGDNPTDTVYAIAISADNWVTTQYVKSDLTVGSSLSISDYQSFIGWGGGSGVIILGLTSSTTYKVKVKASQGAFSETAYGPSASASTAAPELDFDLDIASSNSETAAPYSLALGDLGLGVVTTASEKIWID